MKGAPQKNSRVLFVPEIILFHKNFGSKIIWSEIFLETVAKIFGIGLSKGGQR